jgi:hypothetical protein
LGISGGAALIHADPPETGYRGIHALMAMCDTSVSNGELIDDGQRQATGHQTQN